MDGVAVDSSSNRRARSTTGRSTNSPLGRHRASPAAAADAARTSRAQLSSSPEGLNTSCRTSSWRGVDRGLSEEAEGAGELGLLAQPGGVVQVRVDAVDGRPDACGSGGEHEMGAETAVTAFG